MQIDYKAIGARIRRRRKELGLTQAQLAEMTGQEPSNLSHIERGATKLSLPTLIALANALGLTADQLLCDSLESDSTSYEKEAAFLLQGCTHAERQIVTNTMRSLIDALHAKKS